MRPTPLLGAVMATWMLAVTAAYPQTTSPAPVATTDPAPISAPASMPASMPASAPSPAPTAAPTTAPARPVAASAPATKPAEARNIRFQYKDMPLADVVREFAREGKQTILGDVSVDGSLTFFDSELYSYSEAMEMLNIFLEMHNYQLRQDGRFLRCEPLTSAVANSKMLRNLDEAPAEGVRPADIVTVVLPLKYIDSQQAGNAIVRMISPWGQVAQMGKGKGLIVTDRLSRMEQVRNFLNLLDSEKLSERSLRSFTLKKAAAADVSRIVNDLYGPRSVSARYYAGGQGDGQRMDPTESVVATFEDRSNTVFVMGSAEKLALVEAMIEKLDSSSSTDSQLKVFQLQNARAEQVARVLSESLPQVAGPQNPNQPPSHVPVARIVADAIGNRLIVSSPVDRLPAIEEAIKKLDTDMGALTGMRIFHLKFSDAQQLAPIVTNTIAKRDVQSRTPTTPFTVSADARSNALIIAGSGADIELAGKLIEELDRDRPAPVEGEKPAREIQVIHLEAGNARDVAASLVRLFQQQTKDSAGGTLRVEAENATNCLIVSAAQGDWTIVKDILDKLQANAAPLSTPVTRLVDVQHVKASDLASALRQVYDPRTRAPRSGTAQAPAVVIAASPSDKSLLISAVAEDQKALSELIKTMDVEGAGRTQVRTYQIGESSAADIARSLARLFADQGKQTAGEPAPRFEADATTNQLLVAASAAQFEQIEELIKQFKDSVVLASKTETFNLHNAKANEIVAMLQTLLSENVGAKARPGVAPSAVRIAAMSGANAIIVQGTPDKLEMAKDLIEKFDKPEYNEDAIVRVIQVKNAQADTLVETLRALIPKPTPGQKGEVLIQADHATNSILISAPQAQRTLLEEMISQIDKSTELAAREMRTIKLEHAPASSLMTMLNQLYAAIPGRNGKAPDPAERVVITAAPNDKSLVIDAPRKKIEEISALATAMDSKEEADKPVVRMYQFTGASAVEAARALKSLFADQRRAARPGVSEIQPRFEGDSATNQLLIAATEAQFADIEPLVDKYKGAVLDSQTKTYTLKFAKASDVAMVLQSMLTDNGSRAGRAAAKVAAMTGANAVVVQGPADRLTLAEELIAGLDKADMADAITRIVHLENAQAEAVANVLRNMLPPPARGGAPDVTIQAEKLSNSILLRAPESQRKTLEDLIAELDKSAVQAREFRAIALKQASAASLATMLNQMYSGAAAQRNGRDGADRVTVTASPSDQTLVVDAPRKVMEQIVELVAGMDKDGQAQALIRTYQLTAINAPETARSMGRLYAAAPGKNPSAEPAPRFEADSATNQLFVAASARQFDEIEKTIQMLEKAVPAGGTKTFELKFARAGELAPMLTTMLADAKAPGAAAGAAVRVSAMGSANAVVVQGPPDKLAMAEKLIETFDVEKFAGQTALHVVQLKNAEAASLARSIMDGIAAKAAKRPPGTAPDPAELVTVTAETNSNSLLVRGPSSECLAVLAMIKSFDEGCDAGTVQVQLFPLKHADASEMVKSLGKFFLDTVQQQARLRKGSTPPPFSATSDARTNTLIVSTTAALVPMVKELVKNLDEAQDRPLMEMRYVSLASADAYDVAGKLTAMYKDRKGVDRPEIDADTFQNAITIIAKDEDLKTIEPLVTQFDKAAETSAIQVRVIPMTKARADRVADVIRRVYGQMTDTEIHVTDKLPPKPEGDGSSTLFPSIAPVPQDSPALAVNTAASGPAATQPTSTSAPSGTGATRPPITIAVDRSANALIVSGSRQDIANIESMVEKLSASTESAEAEFRVFVMKQADAASVARTLDDLFNPKSRMQMPQAVMPAANTGGRNANISPAVQQAMMAPAPPPVISVVADPSTKSVIVRAKNTDFDVIEPLIKHLDQRATLVSEVRVFPLKNTDATEIAANLRELFQLASRNQPNLPNMIPGNPQMPGMMQGPQQMRVQAMRQMMAITNAQGVSTEVDAANLASVSANRTTNSVVVAAPADVMEVIVKIIQDLDQSAGLASVPVVRFYPLKQAEVRATVTALQELFVNAARRGGAQGPGGGSRLTSGLDQVIVTGDDAGRLIIVSAASEKHELIGKAIEQIDNAQLADQVTVQVYRLESADATSVAAAITTALDTGSAGSGNAGRPGPRVGAVGASLRISADRSSNSLVVRASKEDHARITEIIAKMDVVPLGEHPVKTIAVNNIDPTEAANVLRSVFTSGQQGGRGQPNASGLRPPVVIEASREARMLLVRADDETFKKIQEMVAAMDANPSGLAVRTVIQIKNGQATTMAPALMQAFAPAKGKTATPDETVSVVAEPTSNVLVVTANEANTKRVQAMVATMESSPSGLAIHTAIALKNAQAATMAPALMQAFAPARGKVPTPDDMVIVAADPTSNALVVTANETNTKRVQEMVATMDGNPSGLAVRTVIQLKNAQATTVAPALTQAFAPARGKTATPDDTVIVVAEPTSNTLVVTATEANTKRVQAMVATMESSPSGLAVHTVIPLKNAQAATMAPALTQAFAPARGKVPTPDDMVIVAAEPTSNALVVTANEANTKLVQEMVATMDGNPSGLAVRTVISLKNAQATTVAPALTQAFAPVRGKTATPDDTVIVVAEPTSNALVVTATEANTKRVQDMVAKLDTDTGGLRTELLVLKNAKAVDLAAAMTKIIAAKPKLPQQPQLAVSADPGTNALILSGPGGDLDKMIAMAKELDQVVPEAAGKVYIIPLTAGVAADTAAMIKSLYQQQQAAATRDKRALDPLAVSSDDRANAVVLSTTKEMYEQVQSWVGEIEKLKPTRGKMRIITVEHADPADVQRAIDQLYGGSGDSAIRLGAPSPRPASNRPAGGGASGSGTLKSGRVETTVLPNQRAIIVGADDEDYEAIMKLVTMLEEAASKTKRQVKVFVVKNTTNVRVAVALTQTYALTARGPNVQPRPEDAVAISALPQTDAIVVSAAKEKMEEIAGLIEQLDRADVSPDLQYRIFPLANTMPTKILPTLLQMITQIKIQRPGEAIDVRADERSRSLIIFARGNVFEQLDKIVKDLDKPAQFETAEVLVIPLKKADAAHLATVLTDMLRPGTAGQVTPEARALQDQVRLLRVKSAVADDIPELDLSQPIKVSADATAPQGSNSLLITSTADNLKAMRAIVDLLDTVPLADGVKVRFVHLKFADALNVSTTLKDIFTQGLKLAGKPGTSVAGHAEPDTTTGKGLVNTLNVSADARTNTLVLSGTEESLVLAELICKDLDREDSNIVTEVKLFRLKCADAVRLAPMLQAVFAEGVATPGAEGLRTQVTRLKTILEKKEGHNSDLSKTRAALTIQGDQATNILIVAARADVMPLIADVITTLDVAGAGSLNTVRIFPLVNADATRLQTVVTALYTGPNAKFVRDEDKPTVTVDTRTNALIVSGSENTFAMLDVLLKRLDEKTPIDLRDIRLVPLTNSDAPTLAATIQKMMDARVQRLASLGAKDAEALRVIVMGDSRSNDLIVGGSAEGFQLVKDIADQLDGASPALSGQIQLVPLKEANAGNLAITLMNLFNQRYAAARTPDVQRQKPVILPDLRTNSLMVSACQDDSVVLKSLLEKLDVKLTDPTMQLVVLPLKFNDSGTVGATIRTLFAARLTSMTLPGQTPNPQDHVDISSDAVSNALIVSASKENIELIKGLLEKVDAEPAEESGLVRMYLLKNADATRISSMLQGLVAKGLYKPGATAAAGNAALAAREKISIAVDTRTNVLIVSASKENLAVLEEIIKKVDDSDSVNMLSDIQMFTLLYADATRVAPVLQQFYTAKRAAEVAAGDTGKSMTVVVSADVRTNSLLVAGSPESFASLKAMVEKLDAKDVIASGNFQIFPLKHATATVLQTMIQKLFDQRVIRPGQTKDPVTVVANQVANALIVNATDADMKVAEMLITKLDVMPGEGTAMQVYPLQKADATQVANVIRNLYSGTAAGGTSGSSVGPAGITVSSDDRMNAVIVVAGEADIKRIEEVIRQLDSDAVARVTEIRVFQLSNADATELGTVLTDTLTNKLKSPNPQFIKGQNLMQFITRTAEGKELVASALQEGVLISPDKRTNSLVVSAPVSSMPLLENLIKAMDNGLPRAAEIRMFAMKNADAMQMSNVLSSLFRLTGTGAANPHAVSYTLVAASQPAGGASATLGTAEQYTLTVTVDVRTNSLLVGGTKQYVDLCSKVIEELDASPAQERQTQVYRLHNARAADVQTALRSFLDQERTRLIEALGNDKMGAAQRLLEHEVAVVAVPSDGVLDKGNTLLISASPRYFAIVSDMIKELDAAPAQVLVQVLLAEVTLTDETDIGVEASYTATSGKYTYGTGTDFNLRSSFATNGGFNVSVTGGDINFFLRALQNSGKLEVLSRPSVLAQDNQLAHINIGQRVPYISNSQTTDTGNMLNTIDYQNVGIMLDVTPRINPEGFVKLLVKPEVSSVSSSTVPLATGLTATLFNTREASTTVTVQDGHTIVIGGLITTSNDLTEQKVPVLGDIPLLGGLFKSTVRKKARTELLIVLTPRVMAAVGTCDAVTDQQKRGLQLLRTMDTDGPKNDLFSPLESLLGTRKMATSQPFITTDMMVPDTDNCPPATTQPGSR